ncbi:TetR/AcrR family transcriptional regulator [Stackebrandtia nassauensis]|uniref:Transcriptional regulator, TetR family n=1 Tax=Stackebrandtia nassauensis (strain DSM 44728 / CIP 108903 / NRRL B-16338 / NBRC 102104 / LLR-40K-21) TaxID=446470 RepID=D3Q9T4_STANL|nr:TetR/AcrR family transcriptional regulator [Stackebrandtia nassauensis]ADD44630.1 transcriptional regulator, TetR family [Stackebrandtia nassauensis DSM 44728]
MDVRHDTQQAVRPKGRPRSTAVGEAITEATLDLIAESGSIETLSIEAIATRAGVGKATIYRRWPNKEALVVDAVGTLKGAIPELDGDSVRADLIVLANTIRRSSDTREGKILPCLILELKRNPELARQYDKAMNSRREVTKDVLRGGIARGELRADIDIDTVTAMFSAPLLMMSVMGNYNEVEREGLAERVVDTLLNGIAAR